MSTRERGFTLLETTVALGVFAILLAAGFWTMAARPAALVSAADDFDSALASARSIASSSGNGATIVFAPRPSGFSLRVYRGRPNAASAVSATNVMQVDAGATVHERTLGAPPFSLFIDSAGNASGSPRYPSFDPGGNPVFSVLSREPPCPAGGFVLTIANLQRTAAAVRTLACAVALPASAPAASPTPNAPLVTPTVLLFHWPADVQRTFVATEWGYTHWFASATGFSCGDGVAVYPNVLPSPYSEPPNESEGSLPPAPPADTPFSYPNANGGSMNDAPALFLLAPQGGGLCTAGILDDHAQRAAVSVVVMGWLTVVYSGTAATHASPALAIPAGALARVGSTATLALSKTFDTQGLQPRVAFTGDTAQSCAADLGTTISAGNTPPTPSSTPSTASLTFTVAALPPASLACNGLVYNHYSDALAPDDAAAQAGEGVPFTTTLGSAPAPLAVWPSGVVYALAGQEIGGGCRAIAYSDAALTVVDANDTRYASLGAATDAAGCYDGAIVASENAYSGAFGATNQGCSGSVAIGTWSPAGSPVSALGVSGGSPWIAHCAIAISSSDQTLSNGGARNVAVAVDSCSRNDAVVNVGSGCEFTVLSGPNPHDCVLGGYEGVFYQDLVSQHPALGVLQIVDAKEAGGGPTTYTYLWTRTAPGVETITVVENETICIAEGQFEPYGSSTTTLTYN